MCTTNNNDNQESVNKIDEFVDSDGGVISGDRNVTSNSEIETGPVSKPWNDNSDYEKGVSTTTDRATRYTQDIPWFAVYSYNGGNNRGVSMNETKKNITKKQFEDEIMEDLVKKSKSDRDVFEKTYNGKIEKVIDVINDTDLTDEQLNKIKIAILSKIKGKNG